MSLSESMERIFSRTLPFKALDVYRTSMDRAKKPFTVLEELPTYKEVPFPSIDSFMISDQSQCHVLDQFYFIVLFNCMTPSKHVGFLCSKVKLHPTDADRLFTLLVDHMRFFYHNAAKKYATEVWENHGPKSDLSVPKGMIRLESGYIQLA